MAVAQGPSGGFLGILKNLIVFIISYGYIPFQWYLNKSTKKPVLDISSLPILTNQVVVLTGANGGLGSALVKKLLRMDADVVVGVRNPEEMKRILQDAREETMAGNLTSYRLDLSSFESVRTFAGEVCKLDKSIRVLINAGGIQGDSYEQTRDGNEKQFQVNYLAHFLLSNLLIPKMAASSSEAEPSGIINLSSTVQSYGKLDLQNLNSEKWYNRMQAFYNSKLCVAASSHFLGLRLKQKGIYVRVNAVHPGFLGTKQWDHYCIGILQKLWEKQLMPPSSGAEDVLYVALHPQVQNVTGAFFVNQTVDPGIPKLKWTQLEELWDASSELANIDNIYSLASADAGTGTGKDSPPQQPKLNNEVLMDLDLDAKGHKNKIQKNNRTLSVITINNLEGYSSAAGKNSPIKRGQSQIFSTPAASGSDAVAPLEVGFGMTNIGVLASVAPVVGIMSSTIAGQGRNYDRLPAIV